MANSTSISTTSSNKTAKHTSAHVKQISIVTKSGKEISPYLDAAARLRIEVFREYPYLYNGDLAYENDYLRYYCECEQSIFVLAYSDQEIIGVSTGLPLSSANAAFQQAFADHDVSIENIFYLGESVLLSEYRGRGIGHAFFDHRENHAKLLGYHTTAFCAVDRPENHILRPANYRSNAHLWQKRNYQEHRELSANLAWQEIGHTEEQQNTLHFWLRHAP